MRIVADIDIPFLEGVFEPYADVFYKKGDEIVREDLMDADVLYTVRVSNKEIDTNRHLNNQKSAELLMDALPLDFSFSDMTVFYKKSAYLGDELELCAKEISNGYYIHLQTKEKEICVAGTFTK